MEPTHQKHAALARPDLGEFGRHELGLLGAPCGVIKDLAARLLPLLTPALRVAYVDADHAAGDEAEAGGAGGADAILQAGATAELTDKIHFRRLDVRRGLDKFIQPQWLNEQSLVLVNGNHFRARQQVIIIDPRKPLDKKLDRLTDVQLVLLSEGQTELPAALRAYLPALSQVPVLPLADTAAIAAWLLQWLQQRQPPLRGLVLTGGRSQRMHEDKSLLRYHGLEQRAHAAALLAPFCEDVLISCRPEQAAGLPTGLQPLPDQFLDLGPLSGLLSAFRHDPNAAWLVVACDLPFLTEQTLHYLVEHRRPGRMATALQSPDNEFPEPLITIWEPRSYPLLLQMLALGYSCPRKTLINADIELLPAPAPLELRNVNTPAERDAARQALAPRR
ncbi:NTP transferase domain-containing protein [Hymenobacter sp. 15J16-1T3B]|uniref:NTP transferase domain-containing protein n=1 Tax=Hymenobacter sp. 15J16-1T3B TaxID=2886941 RepID=UPI001D125CBE|nr:NTP transferase domain-containing protein [Hymenobacter sp. 15J16-1T3B]MCC3159809.1 NTP transferase domain-containing protein [Hymenobacter sp. 15J16-1T3B]